MVKYMFLYGMCTYFNIRGNMHQMVGNLFNSLYQSLFEKYVWEILMRKIYKIYR